jgi:TolB protein
MLTKHVTPAIEAYLDHQLAAEEREQFEAHLAVCLACTRQFYIAQRLAAELKPTMDAALGHPSLSPTLRYRIRHALEAAESTPHSFFGWAAPGRLLNAVGTVAMIGLLAFGALTVIQGQLPGSNVLPEIGSLSSGSDGQGEQGAPVTEPPLPLTDAASTPTPHRFTLRDTLPQKTPLPAQVVSENTSPTQKPPFAIKEGDQSSENQTEPSAASQSPPGTIAFSFFNQAANRQVYEIHLISPDGTDHRLFPLDGVSEPALHSTTGEYQLAYRAWGEPTRSLLSSKLDGERPYRIGGFWEDAQPDWSPIEDRIIFASQREVDRRWRLYTIWGDGSTEVNLRREGKSPTFAPDGKRFAFESCDNTGNRCGLWVGDLNNSEYGSQPFLEDPRAKSPDWSPVGEQIAYMAELNGNWELYLVNSDGNGRRRLTNDPAVDGLPAWSPDGQWLAFLSDRENNWSIWLLHVASGELRRVFSFDGGVFTPPARDPYGQRNWWDEQISWEK